MSDRKKVNGPGNSVYLSTLVKNLLNSEKDAAAVFVIEKTHAHGIAEHCYMNMSLGDAMHGIAHIILGIAKQEGISAEKVAIHMVRSFSDALSCESSGPQDYDASTWKTPPAAA